MDGLTPTGRGCEDNTPDCQEGDSWRASGLSPEQGSLGRRTPGGDLACAKVRPCLPGWGQTTTEIKKSELVCRVLVPWRKDGRRAEAGHRVAAILARWAGRQWRGPEELPARQRGQHVQRPLGSEAGLLEGLGRRPLGSGEGLLMPGSQPQPGAVHSRLHPGPCLSLLPTLLGAMGGHIPSPTALWVPSSAVGRQIQGVPPKAARPCLVGGTLGSRQEQGSAFWGFPCPHPVPLTSQTTRE